MAYVELQPSSIAAWSGVELRGPLTGGARNQTMWAERGSERLVVRHSERFVPALDWELDLLEFLDIRGIGVPRLVPTDDGRRHVDGVLIYRFIDGRPPRDRGEWQRAVAVLTAVHEMTVGWPQRPGFASSRQLLTGDRGGDVRLDAMPHEAVEAVRAARRPVITGAECVTHGDVGASLLDEGIVGGACATRSRIHSRSGGPIGLGRRPQSSPHRGQLVIALPGRVGA